MDKSLDLEINLTDNRAIVPVSEEVKGLFEKQDEILNQEAGILTLLDNQ